MNRRTEGLVCAVALGLAFGSLPLTMLIFGLSSMIAGGGNGRRS
jgi:hypothetical protein